VSLFFDFFFVKNGEEGEDQSTGNQTWPETLLVEAESL